eukprot:Pompholyxophrys_punicea_v1_NODE_250_length_2534_cov_2.806374.p3 type:complete len:134 gc:universal NODE_250_length_2534_cov_2.806374:2197-1796(-)
MAIFIFVVCVLLSLASAGRNSPVKKTDSKQPGIQKFFQNNDFVDTHEPVEDFSSPLFLSENLNDYSAPGPATDALFKGPIYETSSSSDSEPESSSSSKSSSQPPLSVSAGKKSDFDWKLNDSWKKEKQQKREN